VVTSDPCPAIFREHMDRDTGIGHPSKGGVAEVVTAQMLVAELGDDLVPVGCVPQHCRGDPAAAWTREDACRGVMADRVQSPLNERPDFFNEREHRTISDSFRDCPSPALNPRQAPRGGREGSPWLRAAL
jgi:hypothetical protein